MKPWQQAHTQESAKTLAPLKMISLKRLLAPLFSHTNTTLHTIKTHRDTDSSDLFQFQINAFKLICFLLAAGPLDQRFLAYVVISNEAAAPLSKTVFDRQI